MDNQIKTSFIPRKPVAPVNDTGLTAVSSKKRVGQTIFSLIASIIFIGALAGGVVVYTWQIKLKKDIEGQFAVMEEARKNFNEKFVQEASRLNTRIESAEQMLINHVSPSSLYGLIEEYTLQTISFSSFEFVDNQDGTIGISGEGEALRYETIVLQSDAFGKSGYLRNVIFTNLQPDQATGRINFSFEATLDPSLILYRESLVLNQGDTNANQN